MKNAMYDIIIIGAGSGGLNIASFMNRVGFKVLLIDKSDKSIGGDCLNYGCVPSKALLHVAKLSNDAKAVQRFLKKKKNLAEVDLSLVADYVHQKKEVIRMHENVEYFRKKGIDVQLGIARFYSEDTVNVNGKLFKAKKIVLATGSRPRTLDIPGINKVKFQTNETIFDLKKLPKRLLVIGGGPIGMELGQAFSRLGSEVHIIQRGSDFLPKENPEISRILCKKFKEEGIIIHNNSTPLSFKDAHTLMVEKEGKNIQFAFDEILISVGRKLNIEGLDLDKAGISIEKGKLVVDEYLRTTNKKVFVCGDVAGSYQFTHAAELHAGIILSNFFKPKILWKRVNYDHLSWVTYTSPEIATFGLNEEELKKRNISYKKISQNFTEEDRAIVDENTAGKLVLLIAKGKLLGGTMIAEHAGELFQELVLANALGLKITSMFEKIYPYPTASRINKRAISQIMVEKLTPFSKKILKSLY